MDVNLLPYADGDWGRMAAGNGQMESKWKRFFTLSCYIHLRSQIPGPFTKILI